MPFSDCFFTATSATCVTGLIRFDTFQTWTFFGQLVLVILMEIGGVGFMTFAIVLMMAAKQRIGLHSRRLQQDSIAAPVVGGIVRMTRFVVKGTAIVEGIGALLLSFYFVPRQGFWNGIWTSVFHSVSAFCNAGFDLMGRYAPGSSLILLENNWYVVVIIMALITIGGLGFLVWKDLIAHRFHFRNLSLHSKIVIVTSCIMTFGGALCIYLLEIGNADFESLSVSGKIAGSLFQSVTSRTAGFCTMNLGRMSTASQFLMILLMLCGGSPGSTAGGMKTTTVAVLFLSVRTTAKHRKRVEAFHRSIEPEVINTAATVAILYAFSAIAVAMVISSVENGIDFQTAFFESVSAVATVGSTLGITSKLGMLSKLLLCGLMIFGRSGTVTVLTAMTRKDKNTASRFPDEEVSVG
ncbi:MAG: Trk family potassium uptake protein [Eubacterium sp.]|nr:Trk family potassium uptake protein [Eubacterium sp.]